jgi:hypothetical protein
MMWLWPSHRMHSAKSEHDGSYRFGGNGCGHAGSSVVANPPLGCRTLIFTCGDRELYLLLRFAMNVKPP